MRIDAPAITGSLIVSGSISVSGSLNLNGSNISTQNGGTISGSAQISALGFVSASVTGSSLISASILSNTITFHKGNQSTLAITLPEGSAPTDISALNTFTASLAGTNTFTASLAGTNVFTASLAGTNVFTASLAGTNVFTASISTSVGLLQTYTASVSTSVGLLQTTASYLNTTFSASVNSRLNSGGGSTDISALNTFTASLSGTNVFTASVNTSITSLNAYTASATESVVTATVTSPGGYYIIDGINKPKLSFTPGVTYRFDISAVSSHPFKFSTTSDGTHNGGVEYTTGVTSGTGFIQIQTGYNTANPLYYYCTAHQSMGNEINTLAIGTLSTTASFNSYTQSNEQRVTNINTFTASVAGTNVFTASVAGTNTFTASVNTSITSLNVFTTSINTFTASVAGTNTFTASVNTSITSLNAYTASVSTSVGLLQTTASYLNTTFSASVNSRLSINTGSFATTGSNSFIGNQIVTGSLFVSGSLRGNVSDPPWQGTVFLVSSTHSMDFSKSNFFQLQCREGNNHISASNWQPGQTVSLKIQRIQANMTASFAPAFKFPSGSAYTASVWNGEGEGVEDIITFITYDTNKIYASAVKNMI